jgi:hypothetical protein
VARTLLSARRAASAGTAEGRPTRAKLAAKRYAARRDRYFAAVQLLGRIRQAVPGMSSQGEMTTFSKFITLRCDLWA